jgi:hypothetical protein
MMKMGLLHQTAVVGSGVGAKPVIVLSTGEVMTKGQPVEMHWLFDDVAH